MDYCVVLVISFLVLDLVTPTDPILHRFRDTTFSPTPLLFRLKFGGVPFGLDSRCWGPQRENKVRLISREIIFQEFQHKNYMITIPRRYRQTRQTEGRTDRQTDRQLVGAYARGPAFSRVHCQHL